MEFRPGECPVIVELTPDEAQRVAEFLQFAGSDEPLSDEVIEAGEELFQGLKAATRANKL